MLRVGLTGGLGSGKSTVAAMLRDHGAYILSADEIGRKLMEPGQPVYAAILQAFGPKILHPDGTPAPAIDRPALARLAFAGGRIDDLNAIVHPATIALQAQLADEIFRSNPAAILIVESALIFETPHGGDWRSRFDRLILVTAPEPLKIARFVARSAPAHPTPADREAFEAEARRRLAQLIPDEIKAPQCDFVVSNEGTLDALAGRVRELWDELKRDRKSA